jgi:hypothetical protein
MLYHLCALLLLCLERVVGFVKACNQFTTSSSIKGIKGIKAVICTAPFEMRPQGCQELEMEKKLTNREEILREP